MGNGGIFLWLILNIYQLMIENEGSRFYLLERQLVLTPQEKGQSFTLICKFQYDAETQSIDYASTLSKLSIMHPNLNSILCSSQLFYINQRLRTKHFLGCFPLDQCQVFYDDWSTSSIVISYRKHQPPPATPSAHRHQRKSNERTIREVKTEIERWRQIALQNSKKGPKRITLKAAAKTIGISKKSIEDYIRFLKLGEYFQFDFQANIDEKMGSLRAFVKSKLRQPLDQLKIMSEIESYLDSTYVYKDYE